MYSNITGICYRCVPVSFHDFAGERLRYNVNICRDKKVIYIRNWIECGIVSAGHLLGPNGYLSMKILKQCTLMPLQISCYMKVLYAQLDITKLNFDSNLKKFKKTVILM